MDPEDNGARKAFIDDVALDNSHLVANSKEGYYRDLARAEAKAIGAALYKTREQMNSQKHLRQLVEACARRIDRGDEYETLPSATCYARARRLFTCGKCGTGKKVDGKCYCDHAARMATKLHSGKWLINKMRQICKRKRRHEALHLLHFDPKGSHAKGTVERQYRQYLGSFHPPDGLYKEHVRIFKRLKQQGHDFAVGSTGIRQILILCDQVPVDSVPKATIAKKDDDEHMEEERKQESQGNDVIADIVKENPAQLSKREQKRRNKKQQKV